MQTVIELEKAWKKASALPGELALLTPSSLDPETAAATVISLLQRAYINHAITRDPVKVADDIRSGHVLPWIVTRNNTPVACATLIQQADGSQELGRAVSIENGSGAGKIAMLSAALACQTNLVAEVRLAADFLGVPSGLATQQICHGILGLLPHAAFPPFSHGSPVRHELFAFSSADTQLPPSGRFAAQATHTFSSRQSVHREPSRRLRLVQSEPFRIVVPDDDGQPMRDIVTESRVAGQGCTLAAIEVADANISTITNLKCNEFVTVGLDRNPGPNGLPVVLLATLAKGTLLAPVELGSQLPGGTQDDILWIDRLFRQILER